MFQPLQALIIRKQQLEKDLRDRSDIAVSDIVGDSLEKIDELQRAEMATSRLNRTSAELRAVDEAIGRVNAGEYGICVDCEEEIPEKRLRAVVNALRCVPCQERVEAGSFQDGAMLTDAA